MKPFVNLLFLLLIILCNTSCFTYIPITRELPPEIQLHETPDSIGFVNLFDPDKLDYEREKKTEVFRASLNSFIKGLDESFKLDSIYNIIISNRNIAHKACKSLPDTLNKDTVILLCEDEDVNLLLVLEAFDIYFDKEVDVEKNEDGSKTKTAYFDLIVFAGVSLYNKNGETIDRSHMYIRDFYKSREVVSSILALKPALGKAKDEACNLSYKLGSRYISKFYPVFKTESEKFYTGKEFKEITEITKTGDWQKVIKMLRPLTESGDQKIRYKAAINMSVAFKAIGEDEIAEEWSRKADSIKQE